MYGRNTSRPSARTACVSPVPLISLRKLNATSDASELPRCDYGIVATKAIHTKGAMAQVAAAFDEQRRMLRAERSRQ